MECFMFLVQSGCMDPKTLADIVQFFSRKLYIKFKNLLLIH